MLVRALLPFVCCLIAAAQPAKKADKELDKLQGEWTMVSLETRGKKSAERALVGYRLTVKGDQWIVSSGGGFTGQMTIKLGTADKQKTIDLTPKLAGRGGASQGIYKLEGDTLTLCRGATRPKEFKTDAKMGILVVWKRVKK